MSAPYSDAGHVASIAFNLLLGERCLDRIELLRQDEACLDGITAETISDPPNRAIAYSSHSVKSPSKIVSLSATTFLLSPVSRLAGLSEPPVNHDDTCETC